MSCPYRAFISSGFHIPRALPWATLFYPFRVHIACIIKIYTGVLECASKLAHAKKDAVERKRLTFY